MDTFHITALSPLYEAVQSSGIFPDSKYFVDATPKTNSKTILDAYTIEQEQPGFSLLQFVERYFDLPVTREDHYESAGLPLHQHLKQLWQVLQRNQSDAGGTLIRLPASYIVPGGRFREIYYWDSYFTMLGLAVSNETVLIEQMVENFAYLIRTYGHIPNGNRTYYLSRSQPPFFSGMVQLLAGIKGEQVYKQYLDALETEYRFWMDGESHLSEHHPVYRRLVRLPDGAILNRYWDDEPSPRPEAFAEDTHLASLASTPPETTYRHIRAAAESGWDFSSRWFADGIHMHTIHTCDIVPVDLNCLLFRLESLLLQVYEQLSLTEQAQDMVSRKLRREKAIQQYCWQESSGYFFDYNRVTKTTTARYTLAGLFPLFTGIAAKQQAETCARVVEEQFLCDGGLVTTPYTTGQQWDAPNGWAPLQWIAYKGLLDYGHTNLAHTIRERWMRLNEKTYAATGKMMEKYNVCDTSLHAGGGEYPNQDGFGWTNGVYLAMQSKE
jgi:alpha,alpha-trehalase